MTAPDHRPRCPHFPATLSGRRRRGLLLPENTEGQLMRIVARLIVAAFSGAIIALMACLLVLVAVYIADRDDVLSVGSTGQDQPFRVCPGAGEQENEEQGALKVDGAGGGQVAHGEMVAQRRDGVEDCVPLDPSRRRGVAAHPDPLR